LRKHFKFPEFLECLAIRGFRDPEFQPNEAQENVDTVNPKIYKPPPPNLITEFDLRLWDGEPGDMIHLSTRGDPKKIKVVIVIGTSSASLWRSAPPSTIPGLMAGGTSPPAADFDQVLIMSAIAELPDQWSGIHAAWVPAHLRLATDLSSA